MEGNRHRGYVLHKYGSKCYAQIEYNLSSKDTEGKYRNNTEINVAQC